MKSTKVSQFYDELERIIEGIIQSSDINLSYDCVKEIRIKIDDACNDFYKNQKIVKSKKYLYDRDVEAYIFGLFLYPHIYGDSKEDKLDVVADLVYNAYLHGINPMTSPDVSILINIRKHWSDDYRIA